MYKQKNTSMVFASALLYAYFAVMESLADSVQDFSLRFEASCEAFANQLRASPQFQGFVQSFDASEVGVMIIGLALAAYFCAYVLAPALVVLATAGTWTGAGTAVTALGSTVLPLALIAVVVIAALHIVRNPGSRGGI